MKKFINLLQLLETVVYFVILFIIFFVDINGYSFIYFTIYYWILVFIINNVYYLYNLLKNGKTPKISIYSPTALFAYFFSLGGMSFVTIKNYSYLELIKSANDYSSMNKKQKFKSYIYYLLIWLVVVLFVSLIYLEINNYQDIPEFCLLFIFLILLYRMIIFYDFASKRGGNNNEQH